MGGVVELGVDFVPVSGDRQGWGPPIPTYPYDGKSRKISPISRGYLMGFFIPKNPKVEHQLNTMVVHCEGYTQLSIERMLGY